MLSRAAAGTAFPLPPIQQLRQVTAETLGLLLAGEVQPHLARLRRRRTKHRRMSTPGRHIPLRSAGAPLAFTTSTKTIRSTHIPGERHEVRSGEVDAEVLVQLLLERHLILLWGEGGGVKGHEYQADGLLVSMVASLSP